MRQKLANRRDNTTRRVVWRQVSGNEADVLVTVGIEDGRVREVFCADSKAFKAGSDQLAIVSDACILFSRLLQHGDLPADIMGSMCEPPSLVGAIAQAVLDEQGHLDEQHVRALAYRKMIQKQQQAETSPAAIDRVDQMTDTEKLIQAAEPDDGSVERPSLGMWWAGGVGAAAVVIMFGAMGVGVALGVLMKVVARAWD